MNEIKIETKISEIMGIKEGVDLEFYDIMPYLDTKKFLDPYWIAHSKTEFGKNCDSLIKDFFEKLLNLIDTKPNLNEAVQLCDKLMESKEICFGYSEIDNSGNSNRIGGTDGKGMGPVVSFDFCNAIKRSKAFKNDLLNEMEDCKLFLNGISHDRISDIIGNIIRIELLKFTKQQCDKYAPHLLKKEIVHYWVKNEGWRVSEEEVIKIYNPFTNKVESKLLVPKELVCSAEDFDFEQFKRYIIRDLKNDYEKENKKITLKKYEQIMKNSNIIIDKNYANQYVLKKPLVLKNFKENIINRLNKKNNQQSN